MFGCFLHLVCLLVFININTPVYSLVNGAPEALANQGIPWLMDISKFATGRAEVRQGTHSSSNKVIAVFFKRHAGVRLRTLYCWGWDVVVGGRSLRCSGKDVLLLGIRRDDVRANDKLRQQ